MDQQGPDVNGAIILLLLNEEFCMWLRTSHKEYTMSSYIKARTSMMFCDQDYMTVIFMIHTQSCPLSTF